MYNCYFGGINKAVRRENGIQKIVRLLLAC